ncbi:unnamed protein product, partial [Tetraodon nigroviridis]
PVALGVAVGLGCGFALGWHLRARFSSTSKRLMAAMGISTGEASVMGEGGKFKVILVVRNDLKMGKGKRGCAVLPRCRFCLQTGPGEKLQPAQTAGIL